MGSEMCIRDRAKVVDVSSGVESSPGNKQASKIKDFINVTNSLRVGN